MGIPEFFKKILSPIFGNDIIKTVVIDAKDPSTEVDNLGIDANALIHEVAGKAFGYDKHLPEDQRAVIARQSTEVKTINFNSMLIEEYRRITRITKPKTLIVAHDGLVPAAKQKHQRERRYRSALSKIEGFDSNAISAGTPFMENVNTILKNEFKNNGALYANRIIYVSHRSLGEGEHTMLDLIRQGKITQGAGRSLFYGMDSDWFLLAMKSGLKRVQVVRRRFDQPTDIDTLKAKINAMGITEDDFIMLTYLLGNDFIPASPFMINKTKSFQTLIKVYKENGSRLVDDRGEIIWKNFFNMIKSLQVYEPAALQDAKKEDIIFDVKSTDVAISEFQLQRSFWYIRNWRTLGDRDLFVKTFHKSSQIAQALLEYLTPTPERIQEMCRRFCDAIAWTFSYYTKGIASIRTDVYYPYYYAPLLYDLAQISDYVPPVGNYLREFAGGIPRWEIEHLMKSSLTDYEVRLTKEWINNSTGTDYLSPRGVKIVESVAPKLFAKRLLTQLTLVIPPSSVSILSDKQRSITMAPELEYLHPTNSNVEISDPGPGGIAELQERNRLDIVAKIRDKPDRIIYLPNMQYNTTLSKIIDGKSTDSNLQPEGWLDIPFSDQQREMATIGQSISSLNLSARGGQTQGIYQAPPAFSGAGGGRGRGKSRGRGRT